MLIDANGHDRLIEIIFGWRNDREVKRLKPFVSQINALTDRGVHVVTVNDLPFQEGKANGDQ